MGLKLSPVLLGSYIEPEGLILSPDVCGSDIEPDFGWV